jgi:hypothetical protein
LRPSGRDSDFGQNWLAQDWGDSPAFFK